MTCVLTSYLQSLLLVLDDVDTNRLILTPPPEYKSNTYIMSNLRIPK